MEYKYGEFEFKATGDRSFSGYGVVFGNIDRGQDILLPGSIKMDKTPKMLWQHDPKQPIGVWRKMEADEKGLKVEGELLDVPKGNEAYTLMKAGALDGLSIGYQTLDYDMKKIEDGRTVRELKEIKLWEVSVVTFPMNAEASVTDVKQLQSPREVEQLLRKAGVPGAFAKLVSLHGYEEAMNRLNNSPDQGIEEAQAKCQALLTQLQGLKEALNA